MTVQEVIDIIEDVTWQDNGRHYGKINTAREMAIEALKFKQDFETSKKFIQLPCKIGDYIEWRNNWGGIVFLEVTGFEFDTKGNAKKYHTKYSDIQPPIDSEDVLMIIPQEAFDEQRGGLRRK